jgi:hypothetical protein
MVRNNRLTGDEEWMIVRSCVYGYDDDYMNHVRGGKCCKGLTSSQKMGEITSWRRRDVKGHVE